MTAADAITNFDNLRRAVLTVSGPNGPTPLTGADHDLLRQSIDILRLSIPKEPAPEAPKHN